MTSDNDGDQPVVNPVAESSINHGNKPPRRSIVVTNQRLRDLAEEAWAALVEENVPPIVFQRGHTLVRMTVDDGGRPIVEPMSRAAVRGRLDRVANFFNRTRDGTLHPVLPPSEIVDDMMAADTLPLPLLKGIVEAPIFDPDGVLSMDPGYQRRTGYYYHSDRNLFLPPVDPQPSRDVVAKARSWIVDELLGGFPFLEQADRANAIAVLLLPFVRALIPGPTPLHLFEGPVPGTGKTLLADVLSIPALGRGPAVLAECRDEEEWRKRITAKLLQGPSVVLIDNMGWKIGSTSLAAVLTSDVWEDRLLGHSRIVAVPARCVWIATANNPTLSLEIARRTISVRLDARTERPWERTGYRHPDLEQWARENRGTLIWSAITLGQAWIAEGKPPGPRRLGRYESYSEVLGGILMVADIQSFLGNSNRIYGEVDEEVTAWAEFMAAWWDMYGSQLVTGEQLFNLAIDKKLLLDVWGGQLDHGARTRFGITLRRMRDRVIGDFQIVRDKPDTHTKVQRYRLVEMRGVRGLAGAPTSPEEIIRGTNEREGGGENPPQPSATLREVVPGQPMPLRLFTRLQTEEAKSGGWETEL